MDRDCPLGQIERPTILNLRESYSCPNSKEKVTKPFSCPSRLKSRGFVLSGFLGFSVAPGAYSDSTPEGLYLMLCLNLPILKKAAQRCRRISLNSAWRISLSIKGG